MSNVFGTPRFGSSGGEFKKTRTVGAGDTYFRILPPMFSLRESGDWRKYWATHWGYEAVSERDPSKKFQKPFRCILDKDRRTGIVKQDCPACTKREQVEKERAEKEKAIRAQMVGKDEAVIVARITKELASIDEWLEDHKVDAKWYVNAKFKDGSFGSIKLNHKFHISRILELINGRPATADKPAVPGLIEAEGINPLDPAQGVWWVVSRTGTKRSVVDTTNIEVESVIGEVEVNGVKQKMNLKRTVLAPLTDEECEKAGKDCEDLSTLGGASLTYEQIEALISGTAEPDADTGGDEPMSSAEADAEMARQAKLEAEKAAARAAAEKAAAPASTANPQNEAIQKRLAEIAARKAAAEAEAVKKKAAEEAAAKKAAEEAAAAAAAAPASEPQGDPFADMSDEDFAKTFGPGA